MSARPLSRAVASSGGIAIFTASMARSVVSIFERTCWVSADCWAISVRALMSGSELSVEWTKRSPHESWRFSPR